MAREPSERVRQVDDHVLSAVVHICRIGNQMDRESKGAHGQSSSSSRVTITGKHDSIINVQMRDDSQK